MPHGLRIGWQSGRRTRPKLCPNLMNTRLSGVHMESVCVCGGGGQMHPNMHLTVARAAALLSAQPVNKSGFIKYTLVTLH